MNKTLLKYLKRLCKTLGYSLLVLSIIIAIAIWMVSTEKYQNILVQKATKYLSKKLHTKVSVAHVQLTFFNHFEIQGVYAEDEKKDTLASIDKIELRTSELLSNFWNGETAVLKHVSVENVVVNLLRAKDTSRWNYDFISEAFASKKSTDSSLTTTQKTEIKKNSTDPTFDIKEIHAKHIRFVMNDAWRGEDMRFAFEDIDLLFDQLNLNKKEIIIKEFLIDGANILVREYERGKPKDNSPDDTTDWGTPFNPDQFALSIAKVHLSNSTFAYDDGNRIPSPHEFDENHLGISNLTIDLKNTHVIKDTIFSDIENFSATERCGFAIEHLSAKAKVSQVQSQLSHLQLKTKQSFITDFYEMNYKNFHSFNDYISKVSMNANLSKSTISSIDIGYFANILNEYPIAIQVNGKANGTVDHLNVTNLVLETGNTYFAGEGTVHGLPDMDNTIFTIQSNQLTTSGTELNHLIPQTKVDALDWKELKKIQFKGSYIGHYDNFIAKGNLNTTLGMADIDLHMNFQKDIPSYSGNLTTNNFNIGVLLKQKTLGAISMNGKIDGSGFDLNHLNAKVNASVSEIQVDQVKYKDMTIDGVVANRKFDGIFVSLDSNLHLNFAGKLDLSGEQPVYNFNARFLSFNLQKMGITKDPLIGTGYATLNFTGDDIDNFTGTALLKNLTLSNAKTSIAIPSMLLESYKKNKIKTLHLTSSIADATLQGNFNISELPTSIQLYLSHYLPQYINLPTHYKEEEFTFDANIKNIDSLLKTMLPDLSGFAGTTVNGSLNTSQQKFSIDLGVPQFGYKDFIFNNLLVIGAGDFKSFEMNATSGNLQYNTDVVIPSFQINTSMANDTATLTINTQSINNLLGDASINCKASAANSNLYVQVLPSSISVKEDKWQIASNYDLVLGSKIKVQDLLVESGAQRININTLNGATDDIAASLQDIDLESFSNYANLTNSLYYGRINGEIQVSDFKQNPIVHANIYSTNPVRLNQDTIGMVKLMMDYNIDKNIWTIDKSTSVERNNSNASIAGQINVHDSTINLQTNLKDIKIDFLNQFLSDYLQQINGYASGNVNIKGKLSEPNIIGSVDVADVSLKVIFLGATYKFDQAKFHFNNHLIEMDNINFYDERGKDFGGVLKGKIMHNNFSDFNLNFTADADNILCLKTSEYENDLFYGYIPAKMNAKLNGPLDDIILDIHAKPLKGSTFYLPINSTGDASSYDFVRFINIGRNQNDEMVKRKKSYYVKLNMNIEATPNIETNIILDNNTGEKIIAKGNGDINLNVDLGNSINMFGNYVITEGKYLFNFRSLLAKEFIIDQGSQIKWSGDALAANLNMTAVYKVPKKIALYPLVSANKDITGRDLEEAKKEYATYVYLFLKESLAQPKITFDITQPDNKSVGTPAYTKLEQIKNDEKELVSQAGMLLLLGEFYSTVGINNTAYNNASISTVSDMLSSTISSELNSIIQQKLGLKNINVNVGYQNKIDEQNNALNKNQISLNVSAELFKGRVIIDVGSGVNVGKDNTGVTTSKYNIGGDFKAQLLLSEDGRVRASAFRTSNYDATESTNFTKGGVGLSYRKVFNSFADFFSNKKKKNNNIPITDTTLFKHES